MEIDKRLITLERELIYRAIKYIAICDMGSKRTLDSFIYVNFPALNGSHSKEEFEAALKTLSNELLEFILIKMVE